MREAPSHAKVTRNQEATMMRRLAILGVALFAVSTLGGCLVIERGHRWHCETPVAAHVACR
jgi:hypothetical protein